MKPVWRLPRALAALALLGATATAQAAPIVLTYEVRASGALSGQSFADAVVRMTLWGDTDDRSAIGPGDFAVVLPVHTTRIEIEGFAADEFAEPITAVSNFVDGYLGLGEPVSDYGIFFVENAAAFSYFLEGSLGPVSGEASGNPGLAFATLGGSLRFDTFDSDGVFTATVTAVPEPATWALWMAALGAGALRWRRPAMAVPQARLQRHGGRPAAALALLAAGLGGVAPAVAAPVVWDSTYSVLVRARAEDSSRVGGIRFDGLAERFTHTVTLADGSRSDVAVDVTESQTDLGDGRWRIEIGFDADADLFPTGAFAGFAFGSGIDDPLDLTGDWELLSLEQAIYVGGVLRQSYEWLPYIESVGQASPWGGYSLEPGRFGAFPAEVGVGAGVDGLRFTVLLGPAAAVPLPSSGALAGVALVLGALAARPRPARRPGGRGGARARRPLALVKAVGLAGAIGLAGVAAAAPVTVFSGVDAGVGPLDPRPVSTAAAGSFDAAATATGAALQRLDFEGFGLVAIGDGLDLGAGVRVSGEHIRPGIGVRSSPFAGAFNTTGGGTRYLAFMTDAVEPGATIVSTLNFSFDRPIDAFGAMVSGSNADQTLMVSFDDGDAHEFVVPPGGSGVAFFGLRSDGGSFSSITFTQTWTNTYAVDLVYSVGLDDLAFTHAVPLPDSAALAALGLGLASAAARRRRR